MNMLHADFFTSGINLRLPVAIALMVALYILSYLFWAIIWLLVYWCMPPWPLPLAAISAIQVLSRSSAPLLALALALLT